MMKIAPVIFMWLHIGQQPQIQHHQFKLRRNWPGFPYSICPYMGRVRIICCKFNISVILSPSACH